MKNVLMEGNGKRSQLLSVPVNRFAINSLWHCSFHFQKFRGAEVGWFGVVVGSGVKKQEAKLLKTL